MKTLIKILLFAAILSYAFPLQLTNLRRSRLQQIGTDEVEDDIYTMPTFDTTDDSSGDLYDQTTETNIGVDTDMSTSDDNTDAGAYADATLVDTTSAEDQGQTVVDSTTTEDSEEETFVDNSDTMVDTKIEYLMRVILQIISFEVNINYNL